MYIQRIKIKGKKKNYFSIILREAYYDKESKKNKNRTIATLTKWPPELIEALELQLKKKKLVALDDLPSSAGKAVGAVFVINEIAKRLGITAALGNGRNSKLALFQIAGRIITQGSRNYLANEWKNIQDINEIFKLEKFNEDSLYRNLDWLADNQEEIEKKIFKYRKQEKIKSVYLYDVTSSYFEGDKNEYAEYGYNRDKKKGKKQMVIGLLTDNEGFPLSVEVFKGNTNDLSTVSSQLKKLKENFGVERVVFVGDRGMVKSVQIEEINSDLYKWNYLTSITREQIKSLINKEIIQLELFEDKLIEVKKDNVRYILRRNPVRANEINENRMNKIEAVLQEINKKNKYLREHLRAGVKPAAEKIKEKIDKLGLSKILKLEIKGREIKLETDEESLSKAKELDGCYVLKTDVPIEELDKEKAHDRYKDLAKVESAFRMMKTGLEELRPVYVRKAKRTRGHVFVVMLAYMIIKEIMDKVKELGYSKKFIFETLDKIQYTEYEYAGKKLKVLPKKLLISQEEILKKLELKMK